MADRTSIEWTDASWNPIRAVRAVKLPGAEPGDLAEMKTGWHCEKVSPGCAKCYAEPMNRRLGTGLPYKPGHRGDVDIFVDERALAAPLKWRRPRKIFVGSMTDLFADFVTDEMLDRVFAVMALCPQHVFQLLTKRPKRMRNYVRALNARNDLVTASIEGIQIPGRGSRPDVLLDLKTVIGHAPLPNVWLGFSAEDQERFDERWTAVKPLAKAGWLTWWSAEPLLGPVDPSAAIPEVHHHPDNVRSPALDALVRAAATMIGPGLRWVVTGGESGPGARPMHPDWARSLRDRCAAAGVPFLFKQWGEWAPSTPEQAAGNPRSGWRCLAGHPHVARREELYPEAGAAFIERVGKKAAGRTLDGVIHDAYPEPSV